MAGPRSIIRVLAGAGALYFSSGGCAAAANDAMLYAELGECIDVQFQRAPAPDSFSEIDLAADCPELLLSLADSPWVERTSLSNPDYPNLAQLADLRHFLGGTFHPPESGRSMDYARLGSILAETLATEESERGQSWWQRLLHWLRQRQPQGGDADLHWLEAWLEKLTLSKTAAETLAYSLSALLILVAVGLVINEVRLARQGRPPRRRRTTTRGALSEAAPAGAWRAGAQPLPRRVPELLNVCIEYLIRNQRLPEVRSRTNREFLRHLLHTGDCAAQGFGRLLHQAEYALYGDRQIDPQTLQQCRREAATLLGTCGEHHTVPDAPG
jgi:hypothetical protein